MTTTLFRQEAVNHRTYRFASRVAVVTPLGFTALSLFALGVAVGVVVFVVFGEYSPKDTVRGYVTSTLGGVEVYGQSGGTILALQVAEGDEVARNQELLTLGTSRAIGYSAETSEKVIATLRLERQELQRQAVREEEAFAVQARGIRGEIKSLRARLTLLSEQRKKLLGGLAISRRALARLTTPKVSDFVSAQDKDKARSAIVEYNLRLQELDLVADATRSDVRRSEQRLVEMPALRTAREAELRVQQHELSRRIAEHTGRNLQRVVAPTDGVVSGLLVRAGQTVSASSPLMTIIPERGDFYLEVLVPTRTVAFVRPGAPVRVRYDAYPHQRFGTHEGIVESVSRTTVLPGDKRFRTAITEPVYLARVRIVEDSVNVYGEELALKSGMTLTADVLRDQRRIVEWIFDPLISATRRL